MSKAFISRTASSSLNPMPSEASPRSTKAVENGITDDPSFMEKNTSPTSQEPHSDGGVAAWVQVTCSWLIFFNVLGILNTYGQFQTIYETKLLDYESSSNISWIGSVQYLVCYVTGIFAGPVWDGGHLQLLLIVGILISVFGMMMLSLCHTYWQFFLAQAIVVGLGFGFVFTPASAIVPLWFSTRTSFAVGIATTGSSIGKLSKIGFTKKNY